MDGHTIDDKKGWAGMAEATGVSRTAEMTIRVITDMITFKLTSEQTGGAYTLCETTTAPGGGTPPHIQHKDDEAFFVLEGRYEFLFGDQTVQHGPGGHVFVPIGTVHAFKNVGDTTARMLIINSPGGIHEGFFQEAGVPVSDPVNPPEVNVEDQIARVLEIAPKYGIEMLPPAE